MNEYWFTEYKVEADFWIPASAFVTQNIMFELSDIIKIYNSEFQYDIFSRFTRVHFFFKTSSFSQHFFNLFSIPNINNKEKEKDLY